MSIYISCSFSVKYKNDLDIKLQKLPHTPTAAETINFCLTRKYNTNFILVFFLSYLNPTGVIFNSKKENKNIAVVPNIKDI